MLNSVTVRADHRVSMASVYYYVDSGLDGTNYFTKKAGTEKPERAATTAGSVGGLDQAGNKAFFFVNVERLMIEQGPLTTILRRRRCWQVRTCYLPVKSTKEFASGRRADLVQPIQFPRAVRPECGGRSGPRADKRTISAMRIERAPKPERVSSRANGRRDGQFDGEQARVFRVSEKLHVGAQAPFDTGGDRVWEITGQGAGGTHRPWRARPAGLRLRAAASRLSDRSARCSSGASVVMTVSATSSPSRPGITP